ncbi:hypothetical protein WOB77_15235 [Vibrio parahaemolyticus]|uniref:hypothetical protein n=2 Tax=Vibrio parahaemolyticus TaxID=670 RepID=UPI000402B4A9|nr:hypothetical protein [Vibrio parahaemolyticus]ELN6866945.1 hypothetical protein [Vibrio parahaemolyticus]MCX4136342.1 hypothetical protein [Vibrio parahaemolyticus]MCZ6386777.1 hypothetical protein [Vibrio parahaemolyticus]MDF4401713.1 hypothetical protein [Vibrio parahaemolyticus]MDF4608205.1 hypothetical protein [Vibrio parahaemolyticus]
MSNAYGSKLIQVNPHSDSIRFVDLGNIRFVSYDDLGVCKIVFSFCDSDIHVSQSRFFEPDELKHSSEPWGGNTTEFTPVLSLVETNDFSVTLRSVDTYLQVCELFNMIPDVSVVGACSRSSLDDLGEA